MRSVLISWCIGMISVLGAAGCGFLACQRDCGSNCCTTGPGTARKKPSTRAETCESLRSPVTTPKTTTSRKVTRTPKKGDESIAIDTTVKEPPQIKTVKAPEAPPELAKIPTILVKPVKAVKLEPVKRIDHDVVPPLLPDSDRESTVVPACRDAGVTEVAPTRPFSDGAKDGAGVSTHASRHTKTADIQMGHKDSYRVVTGQAYQWLKTWRLRYAPIDQEDPHGGSVTLEGSFDVSQLREGQHLRVRGMLIPAEERNGSARYRVQAIEILD